MRHNTIETLIGAIVLVTAGIFLTFAYTKTQMTPVRGNYTAQAKFQRIDGLVLGGDVRMSGVKIGTVSDIKIDPESYRAVVTLSYDPKIQLPTDTSAQIVSAGLMGQRYITLIPGADETMLKDGEEIVHTQSSVNLESLIGQAIFAQKSGS